MHRTGLVERDQPAADRDERSSLGGSARIGLILVRGGYWRGMLVAASRIVCRLIAGAVVDWSESWRRHPCSLVAGTASGVPACPAFLLSPSPGRPAMSE